MQLVSDGESGWQGPYMATIKLDPWGKDYVYTGGANDYTIMSVPGTDANTVNTIKYVASLGKMSES